jgi:hypothetical protein
MLRFQCSGCGKILFVPEENAGTAGVCACGQRIVVPDAPVSRLPEIVAAPRKRSPLAVMALIFGGVGAAFCLAGCILYLAMWFSLAPAEKEIVNGGFEAPAGPKSGEARLILPRVLNYISLPVALAGLVLGIISLAVERRAAFAACGISFGGVALIGLLSLWIGTTSRNWQSDVSDWEGSKEDVAIVQAKTISDACQQFEITTGRRPNNLRELTQPQPDGRAAILELDALIDPWGKEFQYDEDGNRNGGFKPDVWTVSPRGKTIGNWLNQR